jgi:hypothetical protein
MMVQRLQQQQRQTTRYKPPSSTSTSNSSNFNSAPTQDEIIWIDNDPTHPYHKLSYSFQLERSIYINEKPYPSLADYFQEIPNCLRSLSTKRVFWKDELNRVLHSKFTGDVKSAKELGGLLLKTGERPLRISYRDYERCKFLGKNEEFDVTMLSEALMEVREELREAERKKRDVRRDDEREREEQDYSRGLPMSKKESVKGSPSSSSSPERGLKQNPELPPKRKGLVKEQDYPEPPQRYTPPSRPSVDYYAKLKQQQQKQNEKEREKYQQQTKNDIRGGSNSGGGSVGGKGQPNLSVQGTSASKQQQTSRQNYNSQPTKSKEHDTHQQRQSYRAFDGEEEQFEEEEDVDFEASYSKPQISSRSSTREVSRSATPTETSRSYASGAGRETQAWTESSSKGSGESRGKYEGEKRGIQLFINKYLQIVC